MTSTKIRFLLAVIKHKGMYRDAIQECNLEWWGHCAESSCPLWNYKCERHLIYKHAKKILETIPQDKIFEAML